MSGSVLVAGIDEAGYGPVLGPLSVSATAFVVPAAQAGACLWRTLKDSVTKKADVRGSRIPILDSKKLHQPQAGIGRLERSALSVIAAWRGLPPTLRALLGLIGAECVAGLPDYPWYREFDPPLPRAVDAGGVRIRAKALERDLVARHVQIAGIWSEVLLEGQYNRLVNSARNKAVVLLGLTLRLVQRVTDAFPGLPVIFFIDKQGGRDHYVSALMRSFDNRRLKVIEEGELASTYELVNDTNSWRIAFRQGGESSHLTVALASIISKYVREALMGCFNTYWTRQVPGIRPTAGYYKDGMRFIREIEPHLDGLSIARDQLIRAR